jgi:hypothetical protein
MTEVVNIFFVIVLISLKPHASAQILFEHAYDSNRCRSYLTFPNKFVNKQEIEKENAFEWIHLASGSIGFPHDSYAALILYENPLKAEQMRLKKYHNAIWLDINTFAEEAGYSFDYGERIGKYMRDIIAPYICVKYPGIFIK